MSKSDDTISRQAAIDAICNACGKIDCDKMDKCEKLQLPPANCSEFPNNSDTISRQAAIDAVAEFLYYTSNFDGMQQGFDLSDWKWKMEGVLSDLPSAQPERTGRWEQVEVNYFADMDAEIQESMAIASMFCPRCKRYHNEVYLYGGATYGVNFCPNCGAKMEADHDS